jgi:hypothetical protein
VRPDDNDHVSDGARIRQAAELQALLEGVPLPAPRARLVEYARREDAVAARALETIPDRLYRSLDEVGDALAPVQPARRSSKAETPREESGAPPGRDAYLDADARPGAVRDDDPPTQTLEQQSAAQAEQQERRRQLG